MSLPDKNKFGNIDGVKSVPLRQIPDQRGKVMHMLRNDDPHFIEFGEIYFSWVYPDVIKAWHLHTEMIMNYAVPVGNLKAVLFDDREDSPSKGKFQEFFLGPDHYQLLHIPHGLWYGLQALGGQPCMIANCSTIPHKPDEIVRKDTFDPYFGYDWNHKHG